MFMKMYVRLVKCSIVASAILPPLVLLCTYYLYYVHSGVQDDFWGKLHERLFQVGPALAALLAFLLLLWYVARRLDAPLSHMALTQATHLDSFRTPWLELAIAVTAGLSLFLELAMIRWQVSIFPLLAFYKNFGLFACFIGLGLGYALAGRRGVPLVVTIPLLAWQILLQLVLKYGLGEGRLNSAMAPPVTEQLHMGLNPAYSPFQYVVIYYTLTLLLLLTALAFLPVGQLCGRLMNQSEKLRAYGLNLLGSVLGVAAIHAVSYFWTPPVVWFGVAILGLIIFLAYDRLPLMIGGVSGLFLLLALSWPVDTNVQHIYSPYQHIERQYTEDGLTNICASGHFLQRVHDFSKDFVAQSKDPDVKRRALFYELPYRLLGAPERVVAVGAGTGNDTAAALRMGAKAVDAVEIDPAIIAIGEAAHPERPYQHPGVRTIVNDARSFFRTTTGEYDMVVYGLLDSHSVLSHAANVRLDSFVYTEEGFREARRCLNEKGALALSFFVLSPELGQKVFVMLKNAFDGRPPVCLRAMYTDFYLYLQSEQGNIEIPPELLAQAQFVDISQEMRSREITTDISTDDWPFFYMPHRVYPFSYLGMIAAVLGVTVLLMLSFGQRRPQPMHAPFFLLGAGFMLVETKGITELGLQFGNTWQVIGIVISGILGMGFLANLVVQWGHIQRPGLPLLFLLLSLVGGTLVSWYGGFPAGFWGRWGTVAVLTCPVFFSGMVFSTALRRGGDIAGLMSANLLGAMCGGMLEYNAMKFGYLFLYLLAMIIYALAGATLFLPKLRGRQT